MQPAQLNVPDWIHWNVKLPPRPFGFQSPNGEICKPTKRAALLALCVTGASCPPRLMQLSRPPQCAARFRACMLAIFQHLHAIYENVLHAYRILMRFLIRGAVGNRRRIEYDHIGKHSLLEEPAMIEP